MRSIWKGSISFGLVNIPIALFPATKEEKVSFRQLRENDLSPINYKRVASADGKEVPYEKIVKGYEYEKDQFVVMTDEDFKKADIKATQTIDIVAFVDLEQIDPIFFDIPYYLAPEKRGEKAYALLRETLKETNKVGIAKVVLKTRQHLAAVKPRGNVLALELMHFADEIQEPRGLNIPGEKVALGKKEMEMAKTLVETMADDWKPEQFKDDYREALMGIIHEKIKRGGKTVSVKSGKAPTPTNVVDIMDMLKRSISHAGKKTASKPASARTRKRAA